VTRFRQNKKTAEFPRNFQENFNLEHQNKVLAIQPEQCQPKSQCLTSRSAALRHNPGTVPLTRSVPMKKSRGWKQPHTARCEPGIARLHYWKRHPHRHYLPRPETHTASILMNGSQIARPEWYPSNVTNTRNILTLFLRSFPPPPREWNRRNRPLPPATWTSSWPTPTLHKSMQTWDRYDITSGRSPLVLPGLLAAEQHSGGSRAPGALFRRKGSTCLSLSFFLPIWVNENPERARAYTYRMIPTSRVGAWRGEATSPSSKQER